MARREIAQPRRGTADGIDRPVELYTRNSEQIPYPFGEQLSDEGFTAGADSRGSVAEGEW